MLIRTRTVPILLIAALFAATACAQRQAPRTAVPAPDNAPSATPSPSAGSGATSTSTQAPLGSQQWIKPGAGSEEYRADLESCFAYAQAQIAHDDRIETDSSAAFDSAPPGLGVTELRSGMTAFERKNRRASLYHDCMGAKGYIKQ